MMKNCCIWLFLLVVAAFFADTAIAPADKSDNWMDMQIRILESDAPTTWPVNVWVTSYLPASADVNFRLISIYWDSREGTTKEFVRTVKPGKQMLTFEMQVKEDEAKNDVDVEAKYGSHYYRDGINTLFRYDPARVDESQAPKTPGEIMQEDVDKETSEALSNLGLDEKGNPLPDKKWSALTIMLIAASILLTLAIIAVGFYLLRKRS